MWVPCLYVQVRGQFQESVLSFYQFKLILSCWMASTFTHWAIAPASLKSFHMRKFLILWWKICTLSVKSVLQILIISQGNYQYNCKTFSHEAGQQWASRPRQSHGAGCSVHHTVLNYSYSEVRILSAVGICICLCTWACLWVCRCAQVYTCVHMPMEARRHSQVWFLGLNCLVFETGLCLFVGQRMSHYDTALLPTL